MAFKNIRVCDFCGTQIGKEVKKSYICCEEVRYIEEPVDVYLLKHPHDLDNDKDVCMECFKKMIKAVGG